MSFVDAIKVCFAKYVDFNGRARLSEFWWFVLFNFIASSVIGLISQYLSTAFTLATLLPYIAVTTRRLHDTNKSGWFQLVWIISSVLAVTCLIFGALTMFGGGSGTLYAVLFSLAGIMFIASLAMFIYFTVQPGDAEDNQYGPPPINLPATSY
jgi:uncharacterized membrane protein YhaH (DUF805 family)